MFHPWLFLLLFCASGFAIHAQSLHEQFDAVRAFAHVQKQVEFGPRPSGSPELRKTRDYLIHELTSYGLDVEQQSFTEKTPRGDIDFVNLIARVPQSFPASLFHRNKPRLVIGSHYDTKWFPHLRFVGANDGGSSTAVLLEIARVLGQSRFQPGGITPELVFFDGEECTVSYTDTDGLHGSRHYVSELKKTGSKPNVKAMLLLDMIGDRNLMIQIPHGDAAWIQKIFQAADALKCRDHFGLSQGGILDDHSPFQDAGIPAVDLIDFDYGPGNRWWHTEQDSLDKISPDSLRITGQTVLKVIEELK